MEHTRHCGSIRRSGGAGFTLIEILVVVLIIGIVSAGLLLSFGVTGRDTELEKESARLLTLVNYAREQAELQTRELGLLLLEDGYQFVAYDTRRGQWRNVFEDDALRARKLPDGLVLRLIVEARPVVLHRRADMPAATPAKDPRSSRDSKDTKDTKDSADAKAWLPQVMIFSNGDLTSFELTVEREGGIRSVTLALDDKGQVVAKPMVESKT